MSLIIKIGGKMRKQIKSRTLSYRVFSQDTQKKNNFIINTNPNNSIDVKAIKTKKTYFNNYPGLEPGGKESIK